MQKNNSKVSRRIFSEGLGVGLLGAGLSLANGCAPKKQRSISTDKEASNDPPAPKVSTTALRIWIVASVAQPEVIIRQWNSSSEQAIEIHSIEIGQLLKLERCAADILLYPSRLIGELVQRKWIDKLPAALTKLVNNPSKEQDESRDNQPLPIPAANRAAAKYAGTVWAVPLGFSALALFGSPGVSAGSRSWQQIKDELSSVELKPIEFAAENVDKADLLDRFLMIAIGSSSINPKYGVLFDSRSMKSRLNSAEFLLAAEILQRLACQTNAALSVVGSHSAAWTWINQEPTNAFAILSPSQLDAASTELDAAQIIKLEGSRSWNSGHGILASISSQCQQSAQSIKFIEWLSTPKTMEALKYQVPALCSVQSRGRNLLERATAALTNDLQDENMICELRMPGVAQYYEVLADKLLAALAGNLSCEQALQEAAQNWDQIVSQTPQFKRSYQQSLGLTT